MSAYSGMNNKIARETAIGIGISGLFSRKGAEKNVKTHLQKLGLEEEAKQYFNERASQPEIFVNTQIDVGSGYTTFGNVLEENDITIEADPERGLSYLRADNKRVGVLKGGKILSIKGRKRNLGKALNSIKNIGTKYGIPTAGNPFVAASASLPQLEKYQPPEIELRKKEKELKKYLLTNIPDVEKVKRRFRKDTYKVNGDFDFKEVIEKPLFEFDNLEPKYVCDLYKSMRDKVPASKRDGVDFLIKETQDLQGMSLASKILFGVVLPTIVIVPSISYALTGSLNPFDVFGSNENNESNKIVAYAESNGVSTSTVQNFQGNYTTLANNLYAKNPAALLPPMKLFEKNSTVFDTVKRNISQDNRVTVDKDVLTSQVSQDFLNWNYDTGKAKVIVPGTDSYKDSYLTKPTIDFASNYSTSLHQLGLPMHDVADVHRVGNMSQNNPDIVNFTPIRLASDIDYYEIVPVPARTAWRTVQELKQIKEGGFDIEKHPESGLGISTKVITDDWCIFDDHLGIGHYEGGLKPDDSVVEELTKMQWELYSKASPLRGGKVYNDFKWYDSTSMRKDNPDESQLRAKLFGLWYMPSKTYSIKEGKVIEGAAAAKVSMQQATDRLSYIAKIYPDGKVPIEQAGSGQIIYSDPRTSYYGELSDRGGWGLCNTIGTFVNVDSDVLKVDRPLEEWVEMVKNNNGPEGKLSNLWKSYDLVKFIEGYERLNIDAAGEVDDIGYLTPAVLRMAGFPVTQMNINPIPTGASGSEYAVGVPQKIANELQLNFPNEKILFGPGFTLSMYSCENGLKADGIKNVNVNFSSNTVRLMQD